MDVTTINYKWYYHHIGNKNHGLCLDTLYTGNLSFVSLERCKSFLLLDWIIPYPCFSIDLGLTSCGLLFISKNKTRMCRSAHATKCLLYSGEILTIKLFLVPYYFKCTIKCDQKVEYGIIKSSIVRISPL